MDFIFDPSRTYDYFTPERCIIKLLHPIPGTVKVEIYDRVYLDNLRWQTVFPAEIDGIKLFVLCSDIHRWEVWGFGQGAFSERLLTIIGDAIESYDN